MGNRLYFIILALLMGVGYGIGRALDLTGKYWIWAGAVVLLYILCKKEFAGTAWFEKPGQDRSPASAAIPARQRMPIHVQTLPSLTAEKKGYKELIRLCLAQPHQEQLNQLVDAFTSFEDEEDDLTRLNYVMRYLDEHNIHFIMALDWKAAVEDLEWRLSASLKGNFNVTVELPRPDTYGPRASVSYDNVFADYDKPLRGKGYQIGLIDTASDEYVVVVHRVADKAEVVEAVRNIGYPYLEVS